LAKIQKNRLNENKTTFFLLKIISISSNNYHFRCRYRRTQTPASP